MQIKHMKAVRKLNHKNAKRNGVIILLLKNVWRDAQLSVSPHSHNSSH